MQFKLDPRLARLLGIHTQTRPVIINALWQYIKTHKLQVATAPILYITVNSLIEDTLFIFQILKLLMFFSKY